MKRCLVKIFLICAFCLSFPFALYGGAGMQAAAFGEEVLSCDAKTLYPLYNENVSKGERVARENAAFGNAADIYDGDAVHAGFPQDNGTGKTQKAATLISSFSTTFNRNVYERSYNIALACKNFCYYTVPAGATLSFNEVVGKRTAERGYKEAKVIENGEYVPGVGGGVCQVSTTLYNAWITAGLGVVSVRAHSLPSSYCEMSRDATVSDFTDLILINDSGEDVIVNASVAGNRVAFSIYGRPDGYTYKFESVLIRRTDPPEPVLEYVDHIDGGLESKQISAAKKGYVTELIRHVYKDGKEMKREVVRRDIYKGTAAKVLVKNSDD